MGRTARQAEFTQRDLGRWQLLVAFQDRLHRALAEAHVHPSFAAPDRLLQPTDYLSLFLFGLLNPVVTTLRGLCAASQLERVQREVCSRPVSLGSFSETQHLLDPALLEKIFTDASQELIGPQAQPTAPLRRWLIQDSTLWAALPRRHWALWRHQGTQQQAVRLHLTLHVLADAPARATVTAGRGCARKAWKEKWEPGAAYIGDRYFGQDYGLLEELTQKGCA